MNHGKQDTQHGGGGGFTRQKDAPSRLDRQAERERREGTGEDKATADTSPGSGATTGPAGARASASGGNPGRQADNTRGAGSADSPRASAHDDKHRPGGTPPGAMPAELGDRDERERQLSEPGAGYADRDRNPLPGIRDVEGTTAEADLSTREEGGSRDPEDVATTGLTEQQRRLGGRDDDIEDELRADARKRERHEREQAPEPRRRH